MDSLEALRITPRRRASDRNAEERKARLLRQEAEVLAKARETGQTQGYQAGFARGTQDGHAAGLQSGHAQGLATGHKEGHAAGYQDGLSQGQADGAELVHAQAQRLQALTDTCADALAQLEAEVGQSLIHLAVRIAEQVLRTELQDRPNRIIDLVQDVLQASPQQGNTLTLRLHPEDLALVQAFLQQSPDLGHTQQVADESLSRGGCIVETQQGSIDATLETRWRRIITALGQGPESV